MTSSIVQTLFGSASIESVSDVVTNLSIMSMATRIETDPLLPYDEDDHDYGKPTPYAAPRRQGIRDAWHLFWLSLFSVTILYWLVVRNPHVPDRSAPFELQKSWAQYSPYFPAGDYHDPPKGCKIIQVFQPCSMLPNERSYF